MTLPSPGEYFQARGRYDIGPVDDEVRKAMGGKCPPDDWWYVCDKTGIVMFAPTRAAAKAYALSLIYKDLTCD